MRSGRYELFAYRPKFNFVAARKFDGRTPAGFEGHFWPENSEEAGGVVTYTDHAPVWCNDFPHAVGVFGIIAINIEGVNRSGLYANTVIRVSAPS
jgi:hypothetical protein